jgi:hypothetical protein
MRFYIAEKLKSPDVEFADERVSKTHNGIIESISHW